MMRNAEIHINIIHINHINIIHIKRITKRIASADDISEALLKIAMASCCIVTRRSSVGEE